MHNTIVIIIFVVAMILLPCLAVAFGGMWVSRRIRRNAPNSQLVKRLTPLRLLLSVCLVVTFLVGTFVRQMYPQSPVGAFLNNPIGYFAALIVACIVYELAYVALNLLLRRRLTTHSSGRAARAAKFKR